MRKSKTKIKEVIINAKNTETTLIKPIKTNNNLKMTELTKIKDLTMKNIINTTLKITITK